MTRAVTVTLFVVFLTYAYAHSHDHAHAHDHAHSHEPAHAKYGREINEKAAKEAELGEDSAAHGHSHGAGGCPHAHSHGEAHGHSHEDVHGHEHEASHGHSHDHHEHGTKDAHGHSHHNVYTQRGGVNPHLWSYAIGATLVISAFPCFLLYFIPIQDNSPSNEKWLKVLLAFGSGGLLGDAFLHLIPHAMPADSGSHSHSHSHSHEGGHGHSHGDMHVGGWVLAGIIAFLMVEKVVRIIRGEDGHGHSHGHAHTDHKKRSCHYVEFNRCGVTKYSVQELTAHPVRKNQY
ncbi:hypothetical protein Y032_0437g1456 [Ancylostoma ceylanicum]|uniref:Metal cation transporter, ZIP family n=1 Tax=Ancylostoma ceylanicum TaxID=53326 RepID=A0A016WZA5_9BILA|nr:hypothetical protein Y032_0437g1456 [Ancylostoma ceylanicum]